MLKGRRTRKAVAATLLLVFAVNTFAPTAAYALTSGPTAPEATSFEPVDTTDMVNLQTGNFTYNVPLLDVPGPEGGYPMSLSYHAGIQPNEDASWVGIGWTLNPGAITRNVNGYPDDWDNIMQTNRDFWKGGSTQTWEVGATIGFDGSPVSVNFGLSFSQDTYEGFGVGFDIGFGANVPIQIGGAKMRGSLDFEGGVSPYGDSHTTVGISLSDDKYIKKVGRLSSSMGLSTNFQSVNADLGYNLSRNGKSIMGFSTSTSNSKPSLSVGGISAGVHNDNAGNLSTSSSGFGITIPVFKLLSIHLGYRYERYWIDETANVPTTGSLYMGNKHTIDIYSAHTSDPAFDCYELLDPNYNVVDNPDPAKVLGGGFPDFDNYSVAAQGLGGNIRPYMFQGYVVTQNRKSYYEYNLDEWIHELKFTLPGTSSDVIPNVKPKFRFENDFSNRFTQQDNDFTNPNDVLNTPPAFDASPIYGLNDGNYSGNGLSDNSLAGSRHIEYLLYSEMKQSGTFQNKFFIYPSSIYGLQIPGVSSNKLPDNTDAGLSNQIGGFAITNESGVTYHYGLPAYAYNEYSYNENIDKTKGPGKSDRWNLLTKPGKYAYTWYLTTVTGPDYVDRNGNNIADNGDWGYWVNLEYGKWTDGYYWRNPSEGFHRGIDNVFEGCSKGQKEIYYLNAIRTRTHTAFFEKELRTDGKSASPAIMVNSHLGSPPFYPIIYEQPTGSFDASSVGVLRLNKIYLLSNADAATTAPTNSNPYTTNGHYGNNVIDLNDIPQAAKDKALRVIDLNYDYSLCPGTSNSFDYATPSVKSGKLTLKSLVFKGKGGLCLLPGTRFDYELPAEEIKSGTITINNDINSTTKTGTIATSTVFSAGDILRFPNGGTNYYCVIVSLVATNTFKVKYLQGLPPVNTSLAASTTKNPPYNPEAFDFWGMYKSDFDNGIAFGLSTTDLGNENVARMTSQASSKGTDAWSLRKVSTNLGATINIGFESNKYKSVLNDNGSMIIQVTSTNGYNPGSQVKIVFTNSDDFDYVYGNIKVGDKASFITMFWGTFSSNVVYTTIDSRQLFPSMSVISFNQAEKSITTDASYVTLVDNVFSDTGVPDFVAGNFLMSQVVRPGGGIRVAKVTLNSDNTQLTTLYDYTIPGTTNDYGISSYEPTVTDVYSIPSNVPQGDKNAYKKILYKDMQNIMATSREIPPPGVIYEYVTIQNQIKNPNEEPRLSDSKSTYQFNVFTKNMLQVIEATPRGNIGIEYRRNLSIKDYTTNVGNLKRIIQWGKKNPNDVNSEWIKLNETINQYADDGLNTQQPSVYSSQYASRMAQYNNQGVIEERYNDTRAVGLPSSSHQYVSVMSARETYPSIMMSQTLIDYKTGLRSSSQNLAFDFYSGALTKQLETDVYGNRFLTVNEPAYKRYSSMGLKINNYLNKNMLSQQAASYSYKVDASNNPIGLVAANVKTWGNDVDVLNTDYSIFKQNDNAASTTTGNIWRPKMSYSWMADGSTTDGITSIGSFVNFDWNNQNTPSLQNAGWKKTEEVTLYNVFSNAMEYSDINGNFLATKLGYNNSKVLFTGGPAKYAELAYSGAEDDPVSSVFDGSVALQSASVNSDLTYVHTGAKSVMVGSNQTGFSYSIPIAKLQQGKDYFAAVWMKAGPGTFNSGWTGLFYQVDANVLGYSSVALTIGNWYLVNIKIPASALTSGTTLRVGCFNNHSATNIYFDDFRFHPMNAAVSAYVYDNQTGELTYIIDNNNLFSKFEYDGVGRLTKIYRESAGAANGIKPVNEYVYNFSQPAGAFINSPITNQPFVKNDCPSGSGSTQYITVPSGMFTSCISQPDAELQAQQYAQQQANATGNCTCSPSFSWASGVNYIYSTATASGSSINFTLVINYPSGSTSFTLGNFTTSCCFPTGTRTVPFIIGSSTFNISISPSGYVQVQLVSGPVPSGSVAFHGIYDIYANSFYSAAKSGTFTRNNCPAGQVGSNVTYNVPAYAYTSLVDQPTADQLAQNDVNNNGQNYANNNGTCSVSCSFTPGSGLSFYNSSVSSSGSTASFNFVFPSPNSSYTGGTIGTINGGCRPSTNRTIPVTDGSNSSRVWSVTIYTTGSVQISISSGPPASNMGPPIVLSGTYNL